MDYIHFVPVIALVISIWGIESAQSGKTHLNDPDRVNSNSHHLQHAHLASLQKEALASKPVSGSKNVNKTAKKKKKDNNDSDNGDERGPASASGSFSGVRRFIQPLID